MKKLLLALGALFASATMGHAQDIFSKGASALNFGIGVGSYYSGTMTVPPLSASYDYAIVDNLVNGDNGSISVGGYLGFSSNSINTLVGNYTQSHFVLGARGAFHYQFAPRLDTYAGLMLGYEHNGVSGQFNSLTTNGVATSIFAGARYFFSPTVAGFGELGYGVSFFTLGVSFRL